MAWGAFTLVRGGGVGFSPSPFLNPDGRVPLDFGIITVAFVADRRLAHRHHDGAVAVAA